MYFGVLMQVYTSIIAQKEGKENRGLYKKSLFFSLELNQCKGEVNCGKMHFESSTLTTKK